MSSQKFPPGQTPSHTTFNIEERLIIQAAATKTGLRSINECVRVAVGTWCDSILEGDGIPYETDLFFEGLTARDKLVWGASLQTPMSIETPSREAIAQVFRMLSEIDPSTVKAVLGEALKDGQRK